MVGWNGRRCLQLYQFTAGVYELYQFTADLYKVRKILIFIMGKGKVVCVYRCNLWFLPISTICLLSERGNKHYQTGIVEESGPETHGNIPSIVIVWNCLYAAIKNYDTIVI